MLNKTILIGRLTAEPVGTDLPAAGKVATFSLAFDDGTKEGDAYHTSFINCNAWSNLANVVLEKLHKGSKIAVEGHLVQRKFTRKDGTTSSVLELNLNGLEFLDPKPQVETK